VNIKALKELYWYIRGPLAQELGWSRQLKRSQKGQSTVVFDHDWSQMRNNRISVINRVIAGLKPPVQYLEIGCAFNDCFNSIMAKDKIGVDPVQGGTVRATSDEFFAANTKTFDVIFIDGLHTYEQCRQDAMNAFRCLKKGGFVLFHDMLPRNWREEHIPRVQMDWTGDVWKVGVELMQSKGLDFRIIEIDNGVGVAKKIEDDVSYHEAHGSLVKATFDDYVNIRPKLPIYSYSDSFDWFERANC